MDQKERTKHLYPTVHCGNNEDDADTGKCNNTLRSTRRRGEISKAVIVSLYPVKNITEAILFHTPNWNDCNFKKWSVVRRKKRDGVVKREVSNGGKLICYEGKKKSYWFLQTIPENRIPPYETTARVCCMGDSGVRQTPICLQEIIFPPSGA